MIPIPLGFFQSLTSPLPPVAPTSLVATPSISAIEVSLDWDDTPLAVSYSVYRAETPGGPYGAAIQTGIGVSNWTDTTVSGDTTYYYVVTATNGGGEGPVSNEDSGLTIPDAPVLTAVTGAGYDAIDLSWTVTVSPKKYDIYRANTSGGSFSKIVEDHGSEAYTDSGLPEGVSRYYKVKAQNATGESAFSNEDGASVPIDPNLILLHMDSFTYGVPFLDDWGNRTMDTEGTVPTTVNSVLPSPTHGAGFGNAAYFTDGRARMITPWWSGLEFNDYYFTLDCWIMEPSAYLAYGGYVVSYKKDDSNYWQLSVSSTAMNFFWVDAGVTLVNITRSSAFAYGSWYHIAIQQNGWSSSDNMQMWVNGVRGVNGGGLHPKTNKLRSRSGGYLSVGCGWHAPPEWADTGVNPMYIDEVRMLNYKAYNENANFTPPAVPYT